MNESVTGGQIGADTVEAQKAVADQFWHDWGAIYPRLSQDRQNELQAILRQRLAVAAGNATITHCPGWDRITFDPTTGTELDPSLSDGFTIFNRPMPALAQQVDPGTGEFVALWLKTGAAPGEWQEVGGGAGGGAAWYDGSGAPASGLGADGDYYLDDDTGDVYAKTSGAWGLVANIKGPAGAQGPIAPFVDDFDYVWYCGGEDGDVLSGFTNTSPGHWQIQGYAGDYGDCGSSANLTVGIYLLVWRPNANLASKWKQGIYVITDVPGPGNNYFKIQRRADLDEAADFVPGFMAKCRSGYLFKGCVFRFANAYPPSPFEEMAIEFQALGVQQPGGTLTSLTPFARPATFDGMGVLGASSVLVETTAPGVGGLRGVTINQPTELATRELDILGGLRLRQQRYGQELIELSDMRQIMGDGYLPIAFNCYFDADLAWRYRNDGAAARIFFAEDGSLLFDAAEAGEEGEEIAAWTRVLAIGPDGALSGAKVSPTPGPGVVPIADSEGKLNAWVDGGGALPTSLQRLASALDDGLVLLYPVLNITPRLYKHICFFGPHLYVSDASGNIYRRENNAGDFVLQGTVANLNALTATSAHVFVSVFGGPIYKQTNGTGDFVGQGVNAGWAGLAGIGADLYGVVYNDGLYKQTNGEGAWAKMAGVPARQYNGLCYDVVEEKLYAGPYNIAGNPIYAIAKASIGVSDFSVVATHRAADFGGMAAHNGEVFIASGAAASPLYRVPKHDASVTPTGYVVSPDPGLGWGPCAFDANGILYVTARASGTGFIFKAAGALNDG